MVPLFHQTPQSPRLPTILVTTAATNNSGSVYLDQDEDQKNTMQEFLKSCNAHRFCWIEREKEKERGQDGEPFEWDRVEKGEDRSEQSSIPRMKVYIRNSSMGTAATEVLPK